MIFNTTRLYGVTKALTESWQKREGVEVYCFCSWFKAIATSFQYVNFYAAFSYEDHYFDTIFKVKELAQATLPFS